MALFKEAEFDLMYGGISQTGELLDTGVKKNLIEKVHDIYTMVKELARPPLNYT